MKTTIGEKDFEDTPISLLLSGGGFRATLYHIGIIRYLLERGHLQSVQEVFSVSGGSILAGYLAINWREFCQPNSFATASSYVIAYAQSDVRGRILRRRVIILLLVASLLSFLLTLSLYPSIALGYFWWFIGITSFLLVLSIILCRRFSLVSMFEADLSRYLHRLNSPARRRSSAKLRDLRGGEDEKFPHFRILATDLTSGSPWVFTSNGIYILKDKCVHLDNELLPLSTAVAASAAFPPLFSPIKISKRLFKEQLQVDHYLADGGVYDNLGMVAAEIFSSEDRFQRKEIQYSNDSSLMLVSNAERLFERNHEGTFSFLIQRASRSTDILMTRVLNPFAWWVGCAAWGNLPAMPSKIAGEWHEGSAALPEKHHEIDVYLRQSIKPRPDETLSTAVFLSKPIRESYGWGPQGAFTFELSVANSYRMVRPNVLLIDPDNRLTYLPNQRDDGTFMYMIPPQSGDDILAIVMAIEPTSESVGPDGSSGVISLPKVGEVIQINLNSQERD